jgi:hypothetical protein
VSADTATSSKRLYEVIEERGFDLESGIPSQEVLDELESALHAVWEFLVQPVANAVNRVADVGEANSITFDDIGRLITWTDAVRMHAVAILDEAARVVIVAHDSDVIARGFEGNGTMFSEYGVPNDRERFAKLKRRYGFDA